MHDDALSGPRGTSSGPTSLPGWQILFEARGQQLLAEVEAAIESGTSELTLGARLRADHLAGDEVAALLNQAALRRKARVKFGDRARQLLFTQAGLEQASRAEVAALHAQRFAAADCRLVADLGCGIGTESIALLDSGVRTLAVEIDPFTAQIAAHNLAQLHEGAQVVVGDASEVALDGVQGVFLDPARRTAGHRNTKRLTRPDDYSPSRGFVFDVATRHATGVKLGPGFDRELIPATAEAQWVSVNGQVVETALWFGAVARPEVRRAALVLRDGTAHELTAAHDSPDTDVRGLGEFLYEPDGAVIRARLIGKLAEQLGAAMVSDHIAYLTADTLVDTPFAQAFRVVEQLPASEKQLKRALAARGIGTLEIKKRGADVDPAALRTRLRLKGPNSATLFLTRVAGRHAALLAERV